MSYDDFDALCAAFPAAHKVIQWGGAHVWKVGDKVFAIGGWSDGAHPAVTFKCTDLAFEILKEQPGLRPAPYLASRGMSWIQMHDDPGLDPEALADYIAASYDLVVKKLTRKKRAELGLNG
ncbi:MAG: MmcQ/YjbR family DNA-binding protein [Rhodobiaceae bacterium]|nr:MmcQ/YjbR family DNA-binding protein [Rhodobiaceae bacterium]